MVDHFPFKLVTLAVLIVGFAVLLLVQLPTLDNRSSKVLIKDRTINVELADDFPKRVKGLMNRAPMPIDSGMLFIFDNEDYHGIWMMNMNFPLDIIWISEKMEIVDIVRSAEPCKLSCPSYVPVKKARYVLEVNGGFTSANNLDIGDRVIFKLAG